MVGLVPTPTDREDYYPNPAGARTLSWSNAAGALGTTDELLPQDVYDWATLIFQTDGTSNATNPGVYTVSWYSNPQMTLPVGTDQFVVGVSMDAYVTLPIRAPYVRVQSTSITGSGTHISGGRWLVSSAPASALRAPQMLFDLTTSVPASTATTVNGTTVRSGAATVWASNLSSTTGWFTDVQILDYASNGFKAVARLGAASQWVDRATFLLPPAPWRVVYTNKDGAAAHSLAVNVTIGN